MNKEQLVQATAIKAGVTKKQADLIVSAICESIMEAVVVRKRRREEEQNLHWTYMHPRNVGNIWYGGGIIVIHDGVGVLQVVPARPGVVMREKVVMSLIYQPLMLKRRILTVYNGMMYYLGMIH